MRRSVHRLSAVALLCGGLLASGGCQPEDHSARPVPAAELAARVRGGTAPIIVDVRTADEYAAGHIPGAINIPHTELVHRLGELPAGKSAEIVVHCQGGRRAAAAESILAGAGYTNVRDLTGHMAAWLEGGFPVDR